MYKVTVEGKHAGYSDTAVFIKVAGNGSYEPCKRELAEGVCVKLPVDLEGEAGETTRTVEDIVFAFKEGGLLGYEQTAEIEEVSGALIIDEAEEVVNILLGGNAE